MSKRVELRMHGVSGTPPRELLYWEPVSYLAQGEKVAGDTKTWERNRDDIPTSSTEVKAFHWGSLTSGSKLSAFWILLAPFAFANVAGWMADGKKTTQAFLRVSSLALTALFVAQASVIGVDYVTQLVAGGALADWVAHASPAAVGMVIFIGGWRLSTRSQLAGFGLAKQISLVFGTTRRSLLPDPILEDSEPGKDRIDQLLDDPAPEARLRNPKLWIQQPVLHRLRRLHLSAALLIVALVSAWGSEIPEMAWVTLAMLAVIGLAVLLTSGDKGAKVFSVGVAQVAVYPSLLMLVLASALARPETAVAGKGATSAHLVVFFTAGAVLLFAVAALFSQLTSDHRRSALLPVGATTIAMFMGGALGVAASLMAEIAIHGWAPELTTDLPYPFQIGEPFVIARAQVMINGGAWTSIAMLTFIVGIAGVASVLALRSGTRLPNKSEGRKLAMLTRVTGKARVVISSAAVIGLGLAIFGGINACLTSQCRPSGLFLNEENLWIAWGLAVVAVPSVLAMAAAIWRVNALFSMIFFAVSATIGWLVWVEEPPFGRFELPGAGVVVDISTLVDLAFVLIIFGIGYSILRSILGGFGDPEKRRKVGVLWDIGSFWPRWFHPLAPPAYGPSAVRHLRSALIKERKRALATGRPLVLSAHSQGSVIAAVALSKSLAKPDGFVTYGAPLGHLYHRIFPAVGVNDLCALVDQKLRDFLADANDANPRPHWLNLRREATDYIGADEAPFCTNWLVETGIGHSSYELTPEFCGARKASLLGTVTSPGDVPTECWET